MQRETTQREKDKSNRDLFIYKTDLWNSFPDGNWTDLEHTHTLSLSFSLFFFFSLFHSLPDTTNRSVKNKYLVLRWSYKL